MAASACATNTQQAEQAIVPVEHRECSTAAKVILSGIQDMSLIQDLCHFIFFGISSY